MNRNLNSMKSRFVVGLAVMAASILAVGCEPGEIGGSAGGPGRAKVVQLLEASADLDAERLAAVACPTINAEQTVKRLEQLGPDFRDHLRAKSKQIVWRPELSTALRAVYSLGHDSSLVFVHVHVVGSSQCVEVIE